MTRKTYIRATDFALGLTVLLILLVSVVSGQYSRSSSSVASELAADPNDCTTGKIAKTVDDKCNLGCVNPGSTKRVFLIGGGTDESRTSDHNVPLFGAKSTTSLGHGRAAPIPYAGVVRRFRVEIGQSPSSGTWTMNLMKNNAGAGTCFCTISSPSTSCFASCHESYVAGDSMSLFASQGGTVSTGSAGVVWTVSYEGS